MKTRKLPLHNKENGLLLKQKMSESIEKRITLSFYRYAHIENPAHFRDTFYLQLDAIGVKGRVYVATEGINAQVSVLENQWNTFKEIVESIVFLQNLRLNIAVADNGKSFFKLKIQVKSKIVADGLDDKLFDVTQSGEHLSAAAFNALTDDPETILVDMRNHYESEVGFFEGAIRPDVETFRESLPIVEALLEGQESKNIVMYCTGGIRCEKASAYYKHKGFNNVFQLDGGIIEYARKAQEQGLKNKFKGVNFVFDERLGERVSAEIVSRCHQCGDLCDTHRNCANDACHILFIQCPKCAEKYHQSCSPQCADFLQLPEKERFEKRKTMIFKGSVAGKGRFNPADL